MGKPLPDAALGSVPVPARSAQVPKLGSTGALYWASVSNPASPFVDMVSGAQGTAAS
jgi:hypothetical protein